MLSRPHIDTDMVNVPLVNLLTRKPLREYCGVLEFVESSEDYCNNFGLQWNRFGEIQIDSISGKDESLNRFWKETGWKREDIKGKILLDAGCGAGRFAEIALKAGARVVAVDLSEAVYACRETLKRFPKEDYLILRASLFDLPLNKGNFDGIYSLGVLQHTPDPLGGIKALATFLKPGGFLAVWIYEKRFCQLFQVRSLIRALVKGWPVEKKMVLSKWLTTLFFPVGWMLSWFGLWGERLSHFLPYAARHHLGRSDLRRQYEYSLMDTLDWYGPEYDCPQKASDVFAAMQDAGLVEVRRLPARGMAIVGRHP